MTKVKYGDEIDDDESERVTVVICGDGLEMRIMRGDE